MRVLVVEDTESNRLTLVALLEDEGYEVEIAESVAGARALLDSTTALYDRVVLDLHLGDGLATELVPLVRARCPGAKIVMMSGSSRVDAPAVGDVDALFEKGSAFSELMALLRALPGR